MSYVIALQLLLISGFIFAGAILKFLLKTVFGGDAEPFIVQWNANLKALGAGVTAAVAVFLSDNSVMDLLLSVSFAVGAFPLDVAFFAILTSGVFLFILHAQLHVGTGKVVTRGLCEIASGMIASVVLVSLLDVWAEFPKIDGAFHPADYMLAYLAGGFMGGFMHWRALDFPGASSSGRHSAEAAFRTADRVRRRL